MNRIIPKERIKLLSTFHIVDSFIPRKELEESIMYDAVSEIVHTLFKYKKVFIKYNVGPNDMTILHLAIEVIVPEMTLEE